MPQVSRPDYMTEWDPLIGEDAARKLRRYRKTVALAPLDLVFCLGAGASIGRGTLADISGAILAIAFAVNVGVLIHAQRTVVAAISLWFGAKVGGVPRTGPERFDEWRRARGLMTPEERAAADRRAP